MNKLSRVMTVAAAILAAGSLALIGAGAASAATVASPSSSPSSSAAVAAPDDTCTSGFTKGWTSVDMVITNNSDQTLTFDPSMSAPSTGHWNRRPAETLAPGACEIVNAYAPTDVHIFYLNVMYTMPNGDYVPFSGLANVTNTQSNAEVFLSQPTWDSSGDYYQGLVTGGYVIAQMSSSGALHTHYNLQLH
jgi:hypothetical protein